MKVLHVLTSMGWGGGPQAVLTLARGLHQEGVHQCVLGPRGPMADEFREAGVQVVEVPIRSPHCLPRLLELIRAGEPDLVTTHGKAAGLWGRLAAHRRGVPALHIFHGLHHERYGRALRRLYLALERGLARLTRCQVFVSEADFAEACELRIANASAAAVIRNGVEAPQLRARAVGRTTARAYLGLPEEGFVLGTVARADPVKRLDFLVDVLAGLPEDYRLCVVGDGPGADALWRRARRAGCHDRLTLAGERREASDMMPAFDLYLTASAREGCPLAVLEAMALGLPVVASDIPAHREILGPDTRQLLRADLGIWQRQIPWLRRNTVRRHESGAQNQALVEERYRAEGMVKAHLALYDEVLAAAPA